MARQGAAGAKEAPAIIEGGDRADALHQSRDVRGASARRRRAARRPRARRRPRPEYSQGDLHSLDYSVVASATRPSLAITPIENRGGPTTCASGSASIGFPQRIVVQLRALYRRTWMNSLGGEWARRRQIGSVQTIAPSSTSRSSSTTSPSCAPPRARACASCRCSSAATARGVSHTGESRRRRGAESTSACTARRAWAGWAAASAASRPGPDLVPNLSSESEVPSPRSPSPPTTSRSSDAGVKLDFTHSSMRVREGLGPISAAEARLGAAWSYGGFVLLGGSRVARAARYAAARRRIRLGRAPPRMSDSPTTSCSGGTTCSAGSTRN